MAVLVSRRPSRRRIVALPACLALAVSALAARAGAQRGWFRSVEPNSAYDGQFTFVRLRYTGWSGRWIADYPAMERNFMTILNDLTTVHPRVGHSNVLNWDDPELSRYAVAYVCEPGFWQPTEQEATALREWIRKGGFLIVDDFYDRQWIAFERGMKMVLPDARIVPLDVSHPVFNSFFKIQTLEGMSHPDDAGAKAQYLGIYEDNDPSRRLLVVINYNNDIGDYMEWSGQGVYAINFSNDAYKLATNYVVYGLTH